MFTGIVEEVGSVVNISDNGMTVRAEKVMSDLKLGDSIAVNGACLTAVSLSGSEFSVDLSPRPCAGPRWGDLSGWRLGELGARFVGTATGMGGHIVQRPRGRNGTRYVNQRRRGLHNLPRQDPREAHAVYRREGIYRG